MGLVDLGLFFILYFISISLTLLIMQHKWTFPKVFFMSICLTPMPFIAKCIVDQIGKVEYLKNPLQFFSALLSLITFVILAKTFLKCKAKENVALTISWFLLFFILQIVLRYAV